MDVVDRLFVTLFDSLNTNCKKDLEAVANQYPFEPLKVFILYHLWLSYASDLLFITQSVSFCSNDLLCSE